VVLVTRKKFTVDNQPVQQSSTAGPRFFYGYVVVAAALCIMVVSFGTRVAFGVFFKPVLTDFNWTRAMTSSAASVSMVIEGLLGIIMGGLNDRLGPRVVLTFCGFFLGVGYLLMSQISSVGQIYLFYGVMIGIGMSGIIVPLLSTVSRWFVERRGMMTGVVMSGFGIGSLAAPPMSNWLISIYDWRVSYLILGGIVLVVIIVAAQLLRRNPARERRPAYTPGVVVGQEVTAGTEGLSLTEAVRTRQFWLVVAMYPCIGFSFSTMIVHIVPHATDLGISAATAAVILAVSGGTSIAGNLALGSAGDRIGNRAAYFIGLVLIAAAFFWLIAATEAWQLYLFSAVAGFACGGCVALQPSLVARLFGLKSHGLLFGIAGLGHTTGAALGGFLAGYIFDVTGSYQAAFISCAAVAVIGLILTAAIRPLSAERGKL